MERKYRWTFDKLVILGLVFTFALLLIDLRYDHNHIIRGYQRKHVPALEQYAWIPIYFSGIMVVVGAVSLAAWDTWGRKVLTAFFALSCIVGLLGFWFHNSGHLGKGLSMLLSVWHGAHPDPEEKPPVLSALAFLGLGMLGILASNSRCTPPKT